MTVIFKVIQICNLNLKTCVPKKRKAPPQANKSKKRSRRNESDSEEDDEAFPPVPKKRSRQPSSSDDDSSESEFDDADDFWPTFQGRPNSNNKMEMIHDLSQDQFGGWWAADLMKKSIEDLNDLYAEQYKKFMKD